MAKTDGAAAADDAVDGWSSRVDRPLEPDLSQALDRAEGLVRQLRLVAGTQPSPISERWVAEAAYEHIRSQLDGARTVRSLIGDDAGGRTIDMLAALDQPGRTLTMVAPDQVRRPGVGVSARRLAQGGGAVRVCARPIPLLLVVVDDHAALLRNPGEEALVIPRSPLLASLIGLWGGMWTSARPLPQSAPEMPALSPGRRDAVLGFLSRGVKDEAAARELGVSVRTYRRHVAILLEEMGASSRFQAGALAARDGLLPSILEPSGLCLGPRPA